MAILYLNFEKISQGASVDWIVSGSDSVQMWAPLNMMLNLLILHKVGNFLSTWMKVNFYFTLSVSYFLKHKETESSILLGHDVASKGNQMSMFWGNIMASNSEVSRSS
jgi:hypothetical protein